MTKTKKQNPVQSFIEAFDRLQQRHAWLAFPYAIIKKYSDDEGGYQGALITYYGFLSLFPLLIVATSIIDIITQGNEELKVKLLNSINNYFPAIGSDIQGSIHGSNRTGIALVVGLLVAFYGARGVADAVRHALNHIWEVPKQQRVGFPKGLLVSALLIIGAGLGFFLAAILSSIATAAFGHSLYFRAIPTIVSFLTLLCVFLFVLRIGSSSKHSVRQLLPGALVAAFGFQILQTVGGYLITHQLHNLGGLYGRFGFVLAILFWIYLQAQVFLYAAELNTVRNLKLWPRSLTKPFTEADERAFALYAKRETRHFIEDGDHS